MKPQIQTLPLPHPIEWIVAARTQGDKFEKFAQFRNEAHARQFAGSFRGMWDIELVAPAVHGIAR
jgi:hypothetical protein